MHNQFLLFGLKILLAGLVSFVTLEVVLLVFNDFIFSHSFYEFDSDLGFRVRPYARYGRAQANEFGFNDRDYPHDPQPGTFRILMLSDSFNWMGGPDCNYTAILERKFERQFGEGRVEVIAGGYSQTHTAEQLALLRKFGLRYNPHLVVVGFFAGNDFLDAHPSRKRIVFGGAMTDVYSDREFYATFLDQPLVMRSRLFLFLRERWVVYRHLSRNRNPDEKPAPMPKQDGATHEPDCLQKQSEGPVTLGAEDYLELVFSRAKYTNLERAAQWKPHEQYIFDSLRSMRDLLGQKGIDWMVVAFPAEFQVNAALRLTLVKRYGIDTSDYQWNQAQALLERFCSEQAIEYHDLLPIFQKAHQTGQKLYLPQDTHWNAAGNELAAQFLFDLLVSRVSR